MGGSGLDRTDDFQKLCGSGLDRIQLLRIRIGLGLRSFTVRSSLQGNQQSISQNFSAFFKVYEMSTHQISPSYYEGIPTYYVKETSKLIIMSKFVTWLNFSWRTFSPFIDILLKLQQQILTCFCKYSCNSVMIMVIAISDETMLFCPLLDN